MGITSCDEFFGGRLKLFQPNEGPRVNLDTILLASWVKIHSHDKKIIEAGCASGAISLILAMKFGIKINVTGLDIQSELIELASRNAEFNGITNAQFIHGDLRDKNLFTPEAFDVLVINPPYESLSRGRLSSNASRSEARLELSCTVNDVGEFAKRILKSNGRMFSVFSSERIDVFINAMISNRITPKRIRFVYPRVNNNSGIFLAECIKNAGEGVNILPPLIVRDENNYYTHELLKSYEI